MSMTPFERYMNDPQYKALVDLLAAHIMQCDFTPSEVRLAAMQACIKVEEQRVDRMFFPASPELHEHLHRLHIMVEKEKKARGET
jgi:hypothetical protein